MPPDHMLGQLGAQLGRVFAATDNALVPFRVMELSDQFHLIIALLIFTMIISKDCLQFGTGTNIGPSWQSPSNAKVLSLWSVPSVFVVHLMASRREIGLRLIMKFSRSSRRCIALRYVSWVSRV